MADAAPAPEGPPEGPPSAAAAPPLPPPSPPPPAVEAPPNAVERSFRAAAAEAHAIAHAPDRAGAHRPLLRSQRRLTDQLPQPMVLRGFQLDGAVLDAEIHKTLARQLSEVAAAVNEGWAFQRHDEIGLALSLLLYYLSVWRSNQSFGDQMMNLVFRSEARAVALGVASHAVASLQTAPAAGQKAAHLAISVLLPFAFHKAHHFVINEDWGRHGGDAAGRRRRRVARLLRWVEGLASLLAAVNFMVFMVEGKYRSVVDRVTGMRLVAGRQRMARIINVDFLNQQVFWSVVLRFVSFALPMLNLGGWWRAIAGFRRSGADTGATHSDQCVACGAAPAAMPRLSAPCRHLYCYYCLATRLRDGDRHFRCPRCQLDVTGMTAVATAAAAAAARPYPPPPTPS